MIDKNISSHSLNLSNSSDKNIKKKIISKINENNESLIELKNSIKYIESIDDEGILWLVIDV